MATRAATELHRVNQSLRSIQKDTPDYIAAIKLKAELQAQVEQEKAEAHKLKHEDLEAKLVEYVGQYGDEGLVAQARAKVNEERAKAAAWGGSEKPARLVDAEAAYEAAVREADEVQTEFNSRAAREHREQYLDQQAEAAINTQGRFDDEQLQEQHRKAVEAEFYPEAAAIRKKLNTPYTERAWAPRIVERAVKDAQDRLENTPGVRTVGQIITDNKKAQALWEGPEGGKTVIEGQPNE